jgi:hypothetical protein
MEKLRALWIRLVEVWNSIPPGPRRWIEATLWGVGVAIGTVLWDDFEHRHITRETWAAALTMGAVTFKAALRDLPRQPWVRAQVEK